CWDSFAPEPPLRAYTEEDIRLVFERMRSVIRPEISSTGGSAIFDAKYAEALAKCRAQKQEREEALQTVDHPELEECAEALYAQADAIGDRIMAVAATSLGWCPTRSRCSSGS